MYDIIFYDKNKYKKLFLNSNELHQKNVAEESKIDKFTIDMLVNMLAKAHVSISLVVDDRIAA